MKPDKNILELIATHPAYLTQENFRCLSEAQIGWLSEAQIHCLSEAQIGWLSEAQIHCLSEAQIGWLSEAQIRWLKCLKSLKPTKNIYKKILAAITKEGCSLNQKNWHTCKTTHCVGGWTVTLADGGPEMETLFGTETAATIILRRSRPDAPLPTFSGHCPNDAMMAFIKARAAEEQE